MPVYDVQSEAFRAMQASKDQHELPLRGGGGGGTFPPMETVDAKIAAAEARTDTKFSDLRRDMDKLATTADVTAGANSNRNNVWGAALTVLAILLAILAFGGDRFDAGVNAGGALAPYAEQQRARDAQQDAADAKRDRQFEEILKRLPPKG